MYLIQDDRIVWPQHDISCPAKHLPLLEMKAAGWTWKVISRYLEKKSGRRYANAYGSSAGIVWRHFKKLPEKSNHLAFSRWLKENGIQPTIEEPPEIDDGLGIIYCIEISEHDDVVKIGKSTQRNIKNRLQKFLTSYPPLTDRHSYLLAIQHVDPDQVDDTERVLHEKFASSRIENSEWFRLTPQIQSWINQCDPNALFDLHDEMNERTKKAYKPALF